MSTEPAAAAKKPADKDRVQPRVSVAVTAPGGPPKFDTMSDKVRETLVRWFHDPDVQRELAFTAPAAAASAPGVALPESEKFPPAVAAVLYEAIGVIIVGLLKAKGVDPSALAAVPFTPDERATLAAPTARLFDKYLPGSMSAYTDELILALAIVQIGSVKFAAVKAALDAQAGASAVTPMAPAVNPVDLAELAVASPLPA